MNIPIADPKREYTFLKKDIDKQIKNCLSSQQWVLGPKVTEFEKKASKYLGSRYAIGVASGTDALILSLRALAFRLRKKQGFDEKDEIITTPFTFIATAEAIAHSGARPVFVDVNLDTFNIEPKAIKRAITKNTIGILPVHLYGLAADMSEIGKIAKANNLFVVEDAAQSFGGEYKNKKLGTFGDCGAFSFFPSKNLGGFGDGGLITTNDEKLHQIIKALRNHGQSELYNASFIGYNSRLDSIQAAVLLAKLKYIDKFNKTRIKIANKYNKAFQNISQIECPLGHEQSLGSSMDHVYNLYTIKVRQKRDKLLKYLNYKGISARIYYPRPLSKMKAFKSYKSQGKLINACNLSKKSLSLPINPFLDNKQTNHIISTVKKFYS